MRLRLLLTAAFAALSSATAQVPGLSGTLVVTNKGPSTATIIDVASGRKKVWTDHWGLHNALSPFNPGPVT